VRSNFEAILPPRQQWPFVTVSCGTPVRPVEHHFSLRSGISGDARDLAGRVLSSKGGNWRDSDRSGGKPTFLTCKSSRGERQIGGRGRWRDAGARGPERGCGDAGTRGLGDAGTSLYLSYFVAVVQPAAEVKGEYRCRRSWPNERSGPMRGTQEPGSYKSAVLARRSPGCCHRR
jgi:hypothetical protein